MKAWNKPTHRESAQARYVQNAVITLYDDAKRVLDLVERSGQREAEYAALHRELRTISSALKKLRADECFKMADMATDRTMGYGEFLGGCGEFAMARSGFEGA